MARLALLALLALAVTLACGRPAAPTATPASPAATSTPLTAATTPVPAPATAAPTRAPSPAQPTQPTANLASPTTGQTADLAFRGYQSAWQKVERFRVEIEISQDSRTISRSRVLVVRPDRMHLIILDPSTGAPLTEIIKIGDKSWTELGDRWIETPSSGNTAVETTEVWNPGDFSPGSAAPVNATSEQLLPETLDGVACDRWKISLEIPGVGKSETTAWIAHSDQLPRQVIDVTSNGIRQVQRYSYDENFDIQPPQ